MPTESLFVRVRAVVDPALEAVLHDLTPLTYGRVGGDPADPPAHVSAASALRRSRGRLVIVQDDVDMLAFRDSDGRTDAVLIRAADGQEARPLQEQRDKKAKMDLEACAALPDGRLVAFGSGSTSARERLVILGSGDQTRVVDGSDLYAALRCPAFAGPSLNLEGAVVVGAVLKLFQRGNGVPVGGLSPVNATCDLVLDELLAWLDGGTTVPTPRNMVHYDLGRIHDVPWTFSDATAMADGRIAFLASAESSPDAVRDGEVLGCRFGLIEGERVTMGVVRHADGTPTLLKLEGIEARSDSASTFDVVADVDRPDEPALSGRLEVSGLIGS